MRLRAGGNASLHLFAEHPAARRWAVRAFLPAFPASTWRRSGESIGPATNRRLRGHRAAAWPTALRASAEGPSLLDVWQLVLSNFPSEYRIDLRFRASADRSTSWWDRAAGGSAPAPLPVHAATGTGSRARSRIHEGVPTPMFSAAWEASIDLESDGPADPGPEIVDVARALERASRSDSGPAIAFAATSPIDLVLRRSAWFSELELTSLLPGPTSAAIPPFRGGAKAEILSLGWTDNGEIVGPTIDPVQGRHLAVLGETGMGKSSLLVALASRLGRTHGLILLDPLGTTAETFVRELDPSARSRLVRIRPGDDAIRINALEGIAGTSPDDLVRSERRLNDLVHSLRRVRSGRYVDSAFWGPRLEEMLTRALQAAAAWPQGTLVDAHTLLATRGRLHREIPPDALGPVRELAERVRERPEDAEGARRLLHELVRSRVLGTMLCASEPDLPSSDLVRPGRIVVVSGEARQVGESTARYLLSIYLAIAWSEVLARPSPAKTFVILDEAQWFAHESLAEMLRLGRFANLHVILATQSIASLPPIVAEAVWTNVADFVAFRGSPDEAREIARASSGISVESVLSLPRGRAALLLGKGESVHWIRTVRLPSSSRSDGPDEIPGGTAHSAGPPSGPTSEDTVLGYLRSQAVGLPAGATLRVDLAELRRRADPGGREVRRAGSRLASLGAIVRTEHTPGGTVWTLAPDRIPVEPPSPAPDESAGRSRPPQPS